MEQISTNMKPQTYDRDTLERMGQSEDAEEAVRDEEVQAPTRVRLHGPLRAKCEDLKTRSHL